MFSEVCQSFCSQGRGGSVSREGFCQEGVSAGGGCLLWGVSVRTVVRAVGTHPTGMHCCCCFCRNYRICLC